MHAVPQDGRRGPGWRPAARLTPSAPAGKTARPSPEDLARAVATRATVPDVVEPGVRLLFCGINPGRWSGAVGHHFAHPGNRFWKALHLAGLTRELLSPADERRLAEGALGVTNLVARTTATAAEISVDELRAGSDALARTVRAYRPQVVAFLGLGAYRTAYGRPWARVGPQAETIADAAIWVLPNPSGLQATYGLERIVEELRALAASCGLSTAV